MRTIVTKGRGAMPPFPSIPAQGVSDLITFLSKPELAPPGSAVPGNMLTEHVEPDYPADLSPQPARYKTGYGQEGYVITPPWSTITAYDLNTGEIKWQTPYGDTPQAGPSDTLRGNVFPKSGFAILGSGLIVFVDNQSKFYALDQKTGKVHFHERRSKRGGRRARGLRSRRSRVHPVCPDGRPSFPRGCEDGARGRQPACRPEELRCVRAAKVVSMRSRIRCLWQIALLLHGIGCERYDIAGTVSSR